MFKQEIFAAGKWNGFPFTVDDLHKMASAFNDLKERLKVPLKLGHNDDQKVTDGQPALGWVTDITVDETQKPPKLVGVFDDVPSIVSEAFKKKLYRNVSIELDFNVTHKGKHYDYVVTAVALLGADLPAVNVLNDLGAFLASNNSHLPAGEYSAGQHVSFSVINGNRGENPMPTIEELEADLAKAKAENSKLSAKFSTLETESQAAIEAAKKEADRLKAEQDAAKVTAARAKFSAILEDAVKSKHITPAQRETFSAVLRIDDDVEVVKLDESKVKALFAVDKIEDKDTGRHSDEEQDDRPDGALVTKVNKYIAQTGEQDYSKALFTVMQAEPQLAAQYVDMNGEVQ